MQNAMNSFAHDINHHLCFSHSTLLSLFRLKKGNYPFVMSQIEAGLLPGFSGFRFFLLKNVEGTVK